MLVVGVRSCGRDMDEGGEGEGGERERERLEEVRFFSDLGFEKE